MLKTGFCLRLRIGSNPVGTELTVERFRATLPVVRSGPRREVSAILPKQIRKCLERTTTGWFSSESSLRHFSSTQSNDDANKSNSSKRTCADLTRNEKEEIPIQGQHKSPIVQKLWAARQEAKSYARLGMSEQSVSNVTQASLQDQKEIMRSPDNDIFDSLRPKLPTVTSIDYPFSTDEFLRESYRNPWNEMRFGKILEDLDALAGNIAFRHVYGSSLIVTAGVDRIRLRKRPLIGNDQRLLGQVTWVGKSSMEIRMACVELPGIQAQQQEAQLGDGKPGDEEQGGDEWLEAYFTFVTLDPESKRPKPMPPLIPRTNEERASFELGALKAKSKKAARQNKLKVGHPLTEGALAIDRRAAQLLEEAGPLLRMPSLAEPHSILMSKTEMQNAMIAQPQALNLHDRVFGGFLMRRAFELAFANAYTFGGDKPKFLEVDDISFDRPVDVGDLLVFSSRVIYTMPEGGYFGDYVASHINMPLVMVEVECWVTVPERAEAKVSNHFYFMFALQEGTPCRQVLPGNIDEARRMAIRMASDKEQAELRS